jgi:hypothetical protein
MWRDFPEPLDGSFPHSKLRDEPAFPGGYLKRFQIHHGFFLLCLLASELLDLAGKNTSGDDSLLFLFGHQVLT